MSETTAPPNPDDGNKPGRPRRLTPALILYTVDLCLAGNYRSDVARALGVSYKTFRRWMNAGKKYPDGLYGQFRQAVEVSEATFKTRAVGTVTGAGADDPRLLLEFLGRRYPKQFGQFRGELGALKKVIREQAVQIARMEAELEVLAGAEPAPIPR